jgi:hypothetical protein
MLLCALNSLETKLKYFGHFKNAFFIGSVEYEGVKMCVFGHYGVQVCTYLDCQMAYFHAKVLI